ncbi:DNA cytosine methyltransferase [Commensalibacter nepenthis]|uniref:DNA cytosine methyltransferase n=1 Tax=Commensalibacter nepenthis TaxID=3043872 RepID=A0ABT6Q9T6_9PROT|nr:DNA cytosine methyltransferase [Commensalibacter sp. TBRC 10068]MDI2113659.1 DNA cytosine methyltransferase [Commensalibacter sp. TBRC 10068]
MPEDSQWQVKDMLYIIGFMSWNETSFTILAGRRHDSIYPQAPKMVKVATDQFEFIKGHEYRRMTVRECAKVQTFSDDFIFLCHDLKPAPIDRVIANARL